jgi:hypothetical protein
MAKDEEYVRAVFIAAVTRQTPITTELWNDKVRRAFERPEWDGLRKNLLKKATPIYLSEDGEFAEHGLMRIDAKRMDRVIEKILRGLYYDVWGHRLPSDATIKLIWKPNLWVPFPNLVTDRRVDPRVFTVDYSVGSKEGSEISLWWMRFFESVEYYASIRVDSVVDAVA